jgi:septal ring factor EnvC (AmiA/AmiB activator)
MFAQIPTPPTDTLSGWIIGILLMAVTALISAIIFLSKLIKTSNELRITQLENDVSTLREHIRLCDEDKEKYLKQVASLQAEITTLKLYFQVEFNAKPSSQSE